MDTSSSSKVTVEYHDPSGVFPLISHDIVSRLPLRNLNWQTPFRPLRQIKSLHLEFVPDDLTKNRQRLNVQGNGGHEANSIDIIRGAAEAPSKGTVVKERRHQIPGLQTSPYLKIYVLRCDDKDTYKATERKKLREWIKDNTPTKTKSKKENHDAFEWLILHVVIPDTLAASEPRWREASSKESDELKERPKQGAKWPGKSTRTVFDKLRNDFNESGKSGQDRVAQIRLVKDDVPADLLPTPPVASTLEETYEEREKAWNDLMNKFKLLILGPFDQRVRQYEADITEQDHRRALPGFNFCTFFIHKEGLAKALESIGLVEDALVIYDELALGLETVLKDIASGKAEGAATTFAPYTEDIKERITKPKQQQANGTGAHTAHDGTPEAKVEPMDREYRERIVRSNISVFDFYSYLFSRQKALILRLANARSARAELGSSNKEGVEDLVLISEVAWRASAFIHNNARTLRLDLRTHQEQNPDSGLTDADVDSLVSSWVYAVAGQVLEDTASTTLDQVADPGRRESVANGSVSPGPRKSEFIGLGISSAYPQRTTSLPARRSRVSELQQSRASLQSASENDLMSPPSSSGTDETRSTGIQPGVPELVTYRAELVVIRRKTLEQLAKQRKWLAGWAMIRANRASNMDEIDLNDDSGDNNAKELQPSELLSPALASSLLSEEIYHEAYEQLSEQAMRYFVSATQSKSAESIMGDLAILKYQQGDYAYAVSYFQHVLPLYAADGWGLMEGESLSMHAKSLMALGRQREYAQTMLTLLSKVCEERRDRKHGRPTFQVLDNVVLDVVGVLPDLIAFSEGLEVELTFPALRLFSDIRLDPQVMHNDGEDGFSLRLHLRHLLDDEIVIDRISARLVSLDDAVQDIWLSTDRPVNIESAQNEIILHSRTTTFGAYYVDKVVFEAKKLRLEHETQPQQDEDEPSRAFGDIAKPTKLSAEGERPWMFVYPDIQAFEAQISWTRDIPVSQTRHIEVKLISGLNDIEAIDLKLKPASAGLRLHLADATMTCIERRADGEQKAGQISLRKLDAFGSAVVLVPYSLEQAAREIFVRLEAQYHTSRGDFTFITSTRMPIELPLDVDVNDIFHLDSLFSNFAIRTTDASPLSILQAKLDPSLIYDVEGPPALPLPMTVFDKQPVKLVYKVTRKVAGNGKVGKRDAALALSVEYVLIQDVIVQAVRHHFVEALELSTFTSLSKLLVPVLLNRVTSLLSRMDLEMAALLREANIPSFDQISWLEIVDKLPYTTQAPLLSWLKSWHQTHATINLTETAIDNDLQRRITIAVDVPSIDVVHSASLSLLTNQWPQQQRWPVLALGQPIKAKLTIASTTRWSSKAVIQSSRSDKEERHNQPSYFVFDVHVEADSWLVGGQRRGRFVAAKGVELTFDLVVVPLKLGIHSLPTIDIQPEQATESTDGTVAKQGQDSAAVTCETHYESAGQVVEVIRDSRTTRVHIQEASSAVARPPSRPSTATALEVG